MLRIWVGRAGSGKSHKVLETMQSLRDKRGQVLLVPEHTSHEAEVDLCRALGETASRDAEVLSFRALSNRVLSQTGGLSDFTLDNGGKLLTMRLALQEVHSQLKVFGKPSQRPAFLRQLTDLMEEFYAYEITPDKLYEQVADMEGAMGDKLRSVAMIYAAYDAKLHNDTMDARSRMQKLRDHMAESDYLCGKDIYVDGFSYFNKQEESILAVILRQANDVTVTLLGDRYNTQMFDYALKQKERLVRMAKECGVPCEVLYFTNEVNTPLAHLEQHFFGIDRPWNEETDQIQLYEAGTAFTEVEAVSAQILRLVRSGKYRFRDIAVSARNMEEYGPILENVFQRSGIPAYISRRSDILQKPILTFLLSAVDAVSGGFAYEDMFRYLKTGMAGISSEECDLLENYVICWEIRGNMWLREGDWTANPDGYGQELSEEQRNRLDEINRIRQKVKATLLPLSEGMKSLKTARDKAELLYTFAEQSGVPRTLMEKADALLASGQVQLAEEYQQLWAIFCDVLDQFVEILGDTELSGEEFAKLLRLVLTQYSVGTIPATLDQVKVSEITRNDRHNVKCLFLLGANDHVMPSVSNGNGILDEDDRVALQQHEILLSDATFDPLDNELQNIYACLAQPTDLLFVSYPTTDLNGAQLRPSFVVERIEKLFPQIRRQHEDLSYRVEMVETALEMAGVDRELWRYFSALKPYRQVMLAMERAKQMQRGQLSKEAVRSIYGNSIRMSASRMDQIKKCHFGYFMQYGLRAKERKSAGFDAPEIGTFIHYLLEKVLSDVSDKGGCGQVEKDELHRMVKYYVDQYIAAEIDHYHEKSARFRYLFGRLRHTAIAIIENVVDELAQSDFKPMAFELDFSAKGDLPAITIQEGDTTLRVGGKVDRVDGWVNNGKLYLRVVDYKTGRKSFDLSDLQYGLGIQMLLYLFTLEKEGQAYFGMPVVPAGVLYMPARDEILRQERNISPEKLQKAMEKELRRSGMVLSQPEVLQAMEHSALESPCYLPIHVGKEGNISGGIATATQLGKLGRYVEKLLHDIAREVSQGNIDADPCSHGPQENACTYCEFASACYFEDGRGKDRIRPIAKVTEEDFWQFIEKKTGEEGAHG